jgi:hypothetical protein
MCGRERLACGPSCAPRCSGRTALDWAHYNNASAAAALLRAAGVPLTDGAQLPHLELQAWAAQRRERRRRREEQRAGPAAAGAWADADTLWPSVVTLTAGYV